MRWILVTNSRHATIYKQTNKEESLQVVSKLDNEEIHLRNQDLKEGKPGRTFESGPKSYQRHTMSTEVSPKKQQSIQFARDIAKVLDHGKLHHEFDHIVIVAEPEFLGVLRQQLSKKVTSCISVTIDKDLTRMEPSALFEHLIKAEEKAKSA